MFQPRIWFLVGITIYTISMRLVPYVLHRFGMDIDPATTIYPWNFSPLTAICLFGAAHFTVRRWAFLVPLGALFISDLGIWALTGNRDWAFHSSLPFVYGCFALSVGMGMWLQKRRSVLAIGATGLLAETVFYLVTNFGVWAFPPFLPATYSPDLKGLIFCYDVALPFFGRSLFSTAIFSAVLFSPVAVVERTALPALASPLPAAE